jgi:hypothetical protein
MQSIGWPSSNDRVKTHEGDAKTERGPKPKRIRLSEGEKLTLEAGPIIQKGYVLTHLDCIIFSVYAKLYCCVNISLHSEVSL